MKQFGRFVEALPAFLVALAVGCGGSEDREARATDPFDSRSAIPLRYRDAGRVNRGYPIAIRDVSFASPTGDRVAGLLAIPPVGGKRPAVVYLHGSGESRFALIHKATWLAARGAIALTIDTPYAGDGEAFQQSTVPEIQRARDLDVQAVVEVRRALDLLESLPAVDPDRLAILGFSAGARIAALTSGVERRPKAYAIVSGGAAEFPTEVTPAERRLLEEVDPRRYVAKAAPAALLFLNGRRDEAIPRRALEALAAAGSDPKEVRWYDAGHALNEQADRDQLEWLAERLGLGGPIVEGAETGPS